MEKYFGARIFMSHVIFFPTMFISIRIRVQVYIPVRNLVKNSRDDDLVMDDKRVYVYRVQVVRVIQVKPKEEVV